MDASSASKVFYSKMQSIHPTPSRVVNAVKSVPGVAQPTMIFASKGNSQLSPVRRIEDSSETASNLRAFRMLFGDDEEVIEDKDEFLGFRKDDGIVKNCQLIRARIAEEINLMEKQIRKSKLQSKRKLASLECIQKKTKTVDCSSAVEAEVKNHFVLSSADGNQQNSSDKTVSESKEAGSLESEPNNFYDCMKADQKSENLKIKAAADSYVDHCQSLPKDTSRRILSQSSTNLCPKQQKSSASVKGVVEDFQGFSLDSPLRVTCKRKLDKIATAMERQDDFLGFPPGHPLRRRCIMKLEKITSELNNEDNFLGFAADDPLRQASIEKYKSIATELSQLIEVVKEKRLLICANHVLTEGANTNMPKKNGHRLSNEEFVSNDVDESLQGTVISDKNISDNIEEANLEGNDSTDTDDATDSSSLDPDFLGLRKQVKVLIPNVKSNMSVVKKGPRIKSVRFFGGAGQKLPLSKFLPHQYPWNQSYEDTGDISGSHVGGRSTKEMLVDLSSEPNIQAEAEEEMLLDRQRGTNGPRKGVIKAIIPFSAEDIGDSGFPVITTGPFPPKPLCFLCGSAGIEQVIYCSVCCEPYHPFCAGDDSLMAFFFVHPYSGKSEREDSIKTTNKKDPPVPWELLNTVAVDSSDADHSSEDNSVKLTEQFKTWTCSRCIICIACGKNQHNEGKLKVMRESNQFVACFNCKDTYHPACLGKRYVDGFVEDFNDEEAAESSDEQQQWICENCAKCRSCGVKLDGSFQDKKSSKKRNNLMLCLECFKRRQRGSYCPVCNVSYDDNDYDTRMMECGSCQRWIHAKCEGTSEEQYQVLSHLPECVEFICKLCDKTRNPFWRQAVNMEIINGCESVLRVFTKKALSESRKRRTLNFDVELISNIPESQDTVSNASVEENLNKDTIVAPIQTVDVKCVTPTHSSPNKSSYSLTSAKSPDISNGPSRSIRKSSRVKDSSVAPSVINKSGRGIAAVAQGRTRRNFRKKTKPRKPVELYEISDGSFISIQECKVHIQDLLDFPTEESLKYYGDSKTQRGVTSSVKSSNATLSNGSDQSKAPENDKRGNVCPQSVASRNFDSEVMQCLEDDLRLVRVRNIELTPKKRQDELNRTPRNPITTTPHLISTPSKKVACFIDLLKSQATVSSRASVLHFRDTSLEILDKYFEDVEEARRAKLRNFFIVAVTDVFPWFDEQAIISSDLPKLQPLNFIRRLEDSLGKPLADRNMTDTNVPLLECNPFQDAYWDDANTADDRVCSFCNEVGDLASDGCGRLLWAGLNEWIHVNCALWSSEVWEEETGALQQVGQALSRSKNLKCAFCGTKGASVSCCDQRCRSSFHFPCAIKASCSLNLDKSVFCVKHSRKNDQSLVQHEYQVLRKVFVDWDYIKRKEKPVCSSQVKVFIGSLRIDILGHIIPISVVTPFQSSVPEAGQVTFKRESEEPIEDYTTTALAPDQYRCTRLYWSSSNPLSKIPYQISASVNNDWFRNYAKRKSADEFNIVIDHTEPVEVITKKLNLMNSFHNWLHTAPKLIDEYNVEWVPSCPLISALNATMSINTHHTTVGEDHSDHNLPFRTLVQSEHYPGNTVTSPDQCSYLSEVVEEPVRPAISASTKVSEPFTFDDYLILYERIKDLNRMLEEDIQRFGGSDEESDVDISFLDSDILANFHHDSYINENRPEALRNKTDEKMKNFVANLKTSSGSSKRSKQLMYSMLDGAVNDSSSDASFSSSSSTSSSSPTSTVNSEDENEERDPTTESSTGASDEDDNDSSESEASSSKQSNKRVTRNQSSSKAKKSTVKSVTTGRQLRSREKPQTNQKPIQAESKVKKEKEEIKCPSCQKAFQSQASVNRHSRWCKPTKPSAVGVKRKSSVSANESATSSSSTDPTTRTATSSSALSVKRARGRPPKNLNVESRETVASTSGNRSKRKRHNVIRSDEESESESLEPSDSENHETMSKPYHSESVLRVEPSEMESRSDHSIASDVGTSKDVGENENEDQPKTCDKCKLTYRTLASFNKHLPQCSSYSSSSDDEPVKRDNTDNPQQRGSLVSSESSRMSASVSVISKEGSFDGIGSVKHTTNSVASASFKDDGNTLSHSESSSSTSSPVPITDPMSEHSGVKCTNTFMENESSSDSRDSLRDGGSVPERSDFREVSNDHYVRNTDEIIDVNNATSTSSSEAMEDHFSSDENAKTKSPNNVQLPQHQDLRNSTLEAQPVHQPNLASNCLQQNFVSCAINTQSEFTQDSECVRATTCKENIPLISSSVVTQQGPVGFSVSAHSNSPTVSPVTCNSSDPVGESAVQQNCSTDSSNLNKCMSQPYGYRNEEFSLPYANITSESRPSISSVASNIPISLPTQSSVIQSPTLLPPPVVSFLSAINPDDRIRDSNICQMDTRLSPDLRVYYNSQIPNAECERLGISVLPSGSLAGTYVPMNGNQSTSIADAQSDVSFRMDVPPQSHPTYYVRTPQTESGALIQSINVQEQETGSQVAQLQFSGLDSSQIRSQCQFQVPDRGQTDTFSAAPTHVVPQDQPQMSSHHLQQLQQQINFHQQLQFQNQLQLQAQQQLALSQHEPNQFQSLTSHLGFSQATGTTSEVNHFSPVNSMNLSHNVVSVSASQPSNTAEAMGNNVTYLVVQQGNSLSNLPFNQKLPSQAFQSLSSPVQQAHSNLNIADQLTAQQQQINIQNILLNQNLVPNNNTCPAVIMNYAPEEQQLSGNASHCLRDACLASPHAFPSTQSCSCTKCQEQELLSSKKMIGDKKFLKQASPHPWASAHFSKRGGRASARTQVPGIVQKKQMLVRSSNSIVPKVIPVASTSPRKRVFGHSSSAETGLQSATAATSPPDDVGLTTVASAAGKVPIFSPNIAVVRPMEHPLQKISHQISQLEANFNSPLSSGELSSASYASEHSTESSESGSSSCSASTPAADVDGNGVETTHGSGVIILPPALSSSGGEIFGKVTKTGGGFLIDPSSVSAGARTSSVVKGTKHLYPRPSEDTTTKSDSVGQDSVVRLTPAQPSSVNLEAAAPVDAKGKSIKVILKRKEGGDSYSINDIKESGLEAAGAMRSLKIKGKITSGEQAGTATDVVVVPIIRTIPIVAEAREADGQSEIIRYDEKEGLVCSVSRSSIDQMDGSSNACDRKAGQPTCPKNPIRLTHRAVIVYEVKCNDRVLFRSSDVRAVWGHIFETVQGTRLKRDLPPLAYPATNISLPENQREAAASFNMLGLTHQAVQFLLEQLPGTNSVMQKHRFRFHEPNLEDALLIGNPTGCARTEGFVRRKPFDMFGWLASQHRKIPEKIETPNDWTIQDLPIAMRYRNLREKSANSLGVFYSAIHGRGLFTRRDIQEGEIIIEYAGELIRTILSDRREKYYESRGIGCYFFTIDENVIIDATLKGNAARFINHSCEPNCRSKAVEIFGKKHILIFAERKIHGGEELTYDYKFALEDYDKKIPCTCGARKCRKYLN